MAKTAKGKSDPDPSAVEPDSSAAALPSIPDPEHVAVRAYHIYLERGDAEGDPVSDWLQAEKDLADDGD